MRTCRFAGRHHVAVGETRTASRATVTVGGPRPIQFCPFPLVDDELDNICHLARARMQPPLHDAFAMASWIHLICVRCHPFEDGNGRISRILASIPLMMDGLPPLYISLLQRGVYYDAINQAYGGDHRAMVECILQGTEEALDAVVNQSPT
ncbi:hypothetical protein EXIGLDRAFT_2945 [Exidia glandulosa HHB12029]|uniref:Fido domain-containing protein n=1 Tax=Exidia glandulosa HHB12029 TaxID=1314781 RepID=A0A165QL45_EXIGL|nr:hypothetical protein EXIGLDRAFT_2945 [Exidia glandulosa HHB12029]